MSEPSEKETTMNSDMSPFADHFCKGDKAVISGFRGGNDSERLLRRMGFCEGTTIHWVQGKHTALVRCGNCKVAVEGDLLRDLKVIKKECCSKTPCWRCYAKRIKRTLFCRFRKCRHKAA